MESILNLKPLRVKVSFPGVDYVMVLVNRGSSVNNLKKEIQETLRKLFPHTSYGPISSVRKDNGKVLLPEWYPVDPILKDEEEVVVYYDQLVTGCSPCIENNPYCSKGNQKSAATSPDNSGLFLQYDSIGNLKQNRNEIDQILPLSMGTINSDHTADLLRDLNDIRMDDLNTHVGHQSVNGVLESNVPSLVRKRKGELISDTSQMSESNAVLDKTTDVPDTFQVKKPKGDVADGSVMSKDVLEGNGDFDSHLMAQNKVSCNGAAKNDTIKGDGEKPILAHINKKTALSDVSITPSSILPVADNTEDSGTKINGKKKRDKKEHKRKKLAVDSLCDELAIENQNHDSSTKVPKKKKRKKKSEVWSENIADKSNPSENTVKSKSSMSTGQDVKRDVLDELLFGKEEENTNVNRKKKKKAKKIKERGKDNKIEKHDEPCCSSPSFTASDLKESGIESGSPFNDVEKMMTQVLDRKDALATPRIRTDSNPQEFEDGKELDGSKVKKNKHGVKDNPFTFPQSNSDLNSTVEDGSMQKFAKKNRRNKGSENRGITSKENIKNGKLEERSIKIENANGKSKPIKGMQAGKSVNENAESKPSFDDETDSEVNHIQSNIRKVVDDFVEESDYSQSLFTSPLKLTIQADDEKLPEEKLPEDKGASKKLANASKVGMKSENSKKSKSVKGIKNPEQDSNAKTLGYGSRKRDLEVSKKGENDSSPKSTSKVKKKKESAMINKINRKSFVSTERMSSDSSSDSSSMTFSDCVSHDVRKSDEKEQKNKKSSAKNVLKVSKTEEKQKDESVKEQKVFEEQKVLKKQNVLKKDNSKMEVKLQKKQMRENAEKMPCDQKAMEVAVVVKNSGLIETRPPDHVEAKCNSKSPEKKKKSRRKSRSGSRKSVAKVQNWLSQMADDVPTETECSMNQEIKTCDDGTIEQRGLENRKDSNLAEVSKSDIPINVLCEENGVACDKERDLVDASPPQVADKTKFNADDDDVASEHDIGLENNADNSANTSFVFEETEKDARKEVGNNNYDDLPERKKTLRSSKKVETSKDNMVDLKFNALVEDGGSVISSKVNVPLRPKTSFFQKSLTGFLSREDQQRFQSKLQSKTNSTVK